LALAPQSGSIVAGRSQGYTAEGRDRYDNPVGDVTASTSFTIGPDGSCTANTCTATVAGAHTVVATGSGATGSASLLVTADSLDHLVLSPSAATISAGSAQSYSAEARDRYGNSLGDITSSTTFTVAPEGSCVAGVCTASVVGPHTVTGTAIGATGTAALTVRAGALDHLVLSPANASIAYGASLSYKAEDYDDYVNTMIVWSTYD